MVGINGQVPDGHGIISLQLVQDIRELRVKSHSRPNTEDPMELLLDLVAFEWLVGLI